MLPRYYELPLKLRPYGAIQVIIIITAIGQCFIRTFGRIELLFGMEAVL